MALGPGFKSLFPRIWVRRGAITPHPDPPPRGAAFYCRRLHALASVGSCVERQRLSETWLTSQATRGQGVLYPTCISASCAQGGELRALLDPGHEPVAGLGWSVRFAPLRSDLAAQYRASSRQAASGLLDEVPSCDDAGPRSLVTLSRIGRSRF
jgi:hypothetical protein